MVVEPEEKSFSRVNAVAVCVMSVEFCRCQINQVSVLKIEQVHISVGYRIRAKSVKLSHSSSVH